MTCPNRQRPTASSSASLERFGRIDTLVNNAGMYVSKPFVDYTADDYAAMVGVNLTGFFHLTQLAVRPRTPSRRRSRRQHHDDDGRRGGLEHAIQS